MAVVSQVVIQEVKHLTEQSRLGKRHKQRIRNPKTSASFLSRLNLDLLSTVMKQRKHIKSQAKGLRRLDSPDRFDSQSWETDRSVCHSRSPASSSNDDNEESSSGTSLTLHNREDMSGSECTEPKEPLQDQKSSVCTEPAPDITRDFQFENDDGTYFTETLTLINNDQDLALGDWYLVDCVLRAVDGTGETPGPVVVIADSAGGASLSGKELATLTGWNESDPWAGATKRRKHRLVNDTWLETIGVHHMVVHFTNSRRCSWVEFDVVEDDNLRIWNALLSQKVCRRAQMLVEGLSMRANCACVQDVRSPYLSKPVRNAKLAR